MDVPLVKVSFPKFPKPTGSGIWEASLRSWSPGYRDSGQFAVKVNSTVGLRLYRGVHFEHGITDIGKRPWGDISSGDKKRGLS